MTITKAQGLAMAAIVAAGLLATGGVLLGGRHAEGEDGHAHETADEHADDAAHAGAATPAEDGRRVTLTDAQVRAAGITVQAAGAAPLQSAAEFTGEIRLNEDRMAHVVPRVAGVAEQVAVTLGQAVRQGQVLAVVASTTLADQRSELLTAERRHEAARATLEREQALWQARISAEQDYRQAQTALQEADIALQNARQKLAAVGAAASAAALNRFEVRAPFDGSVVEKHLARGEAVRDDASIFTLADLRTVWAEFNVAPQQLPQVRVGQRVKVSSTGVAGTAEGTVSYVGALLGEQTRTARARVVLANPDGAWRPGLFVTVAVYGDAQAVPLAVPADAVQTVGDQSVVFRAVPGGFEARPLKLGRTDGRSVEVLGGLTVGDAVAVTNAFVLKSELGKADAGHEH